jgi:Mat/Ecp fimbriae periplasmic chaperone
MKSCKHALAALCLAIAAATGTPAKAEMILSQVIVDLLPGNPPREDIEVWNAGDDRMYVSAEPFEIRAPGTSGEERIAVADPEASGILVSPRRLVLEPGERRLIRIAAIGSRGPSDRIFRVSIRPVVGPISAEASALKVLVGYDTLVLVRPERFVGDVEASRIGRSLTLANAGNTAQELFDGRQCDETGSNCVNLPAKRLYPGVSWELTLPYDTPVLYKTAVGPSVRERRF